MNNKVLYVRGTANTRASFRVHRSPVHGGHAVESGCAERGLRMTWRRNPASGRLEMSWQQDAPEEHQRRLLNRDWRAIRTRADRDARLRRVLARAPRVGLIVAATCLSACRSGTAADTPLPPTYIRENGTVVVPEKSPLRQYLVLGSARRQRIQAPLLAPAVLEADPSKVANILPPLSGRISALYVHLGDAVQAGAPLFTLDSSDLAQARSDLEKAQAALTLTEKALKRTHDLLEHGIAAQKDAEQAESDYAQARSEYDRATAVFATFGIPLLAAQSPRQLTVKSPVSGRVSMLNAVPGTFANDNTAALLTVSDVSTIWFTASVQEKDLSFVQVGEQITAATQSYPGETFKGTVTFVSDQLDTDTRTIKVRIAHLNADGRLRPGMFANVTFLGAPHEAIIVPTTSLIQDDAQTEVFVEVTPWKFEARAVTVGSRIGENTELLTGLTGGETIVARQGVLLND